MHPENSKYFSLKSSFLINIHIFGIVKIVLLQFYYILLTIHYLNWVTLFY